MKVIKKVLILLVVLSLSFCVTVTPVFAETDVNMGGVDASVGQNATSNAFKWVGAFAQGIRVTAVEGATGSRLAAPIDYTHYSGKVEVSYVKATKLEYLKDPVLEDSPSYIRTTPPNGMLTAIIGDSNSNNLSQMKQYFGTLEPLAAIISDMKLSLTPNDFMEKDYKLVVEPVAYLTVSNKVHAVTATESAILSRRFDTGYVVTGNMTHPSGKPSNYRPLPPSSADPAIMQAYQSAVNASFRRDGFYCLESGCSANPSGSYMHQTSKNPYDYHLFSVVKDAFPKALFLEKADLGISAGSPPSGSVPTDQILSTYGIGIISYKDIDIEPPLPPSGGGDDEDKASGGYAYDFIADSVSVHTSPIREENDFDSSASFTYQQKIDCKYCTTTCDLCGLSGEYLAQVSSGYWTHYGSCSVYDTGGCDCGKYYVPPTYEPRRCPRCYINCGQCDSGELWYKSDLWEEYQAPTKTATIEIFVDRASLDYTKGINGVLRYTKTMTFTADEPATVKAVLNAGEQIGGKIVKARINWNGRYSEVDSSNNEASRNITVIPATNLTVEYLPANAPFRAGTEIITSYIVHNEDDIGALNIRPKHNLTAVFKAISPSGEVIDSTQMGSIVIPKRGTNLIYFKWFLPDNYKSRSITLHCEINGSHSVKEMNYNDNISEGENEVQKYEIFETPDTIFENRPKYFRVPSVTKDTPTEKLAKNIIMAASYERWEWGADYIKRKYNISLSADYAMTPDEKSPSRKQKSDNEWMMRSGYGASLVISPQITSNLPSNAVTRVQNGNMYLPEFDYKYGQSAHRSMEMTARGLELFANPNTITNKGKQDFLRIHFVPLWYPDGEYRVKTYIYDLWSPVGMLSLTGDVAQLTINGDAYDDWYLSHGGKKD